jgi:uncharacterized protein
MEYTPGDMLTPAVNLPEDLRQSLGQAVQAIVGLARPELIILFGSWAEGTAREDSDVDLLVVADYANRTALTADLYDALMPILLPRSLDVLVYTPESWARGRELLGFITREADQRGVRLYEAA